MLTVTELLSNSYNLNQVNKLFYDGQITTDSANEFFKGWCEGKIMHRWNSELNRPEECFCVGLDNVWKEMPWGVISE